jgi:hypothetical protein
LLCTATPGAGCHCLGKPPVGMARGAG